MLTSADSFRNITTGNHNHSRHHFHSVPPKHSEDAHSSASTFLFILPVTLVIQLLVVVAVLIAIAVLIVIILRLLELLGYCADKHHRLLVFEFMPNGSLQEHLHCRNIYPRPLDWGARLRIALHCARALEYLNTAIAP